jgi:opacity protein-like surface antigen
MRLARILAPAITFFCVLAASTYAKERPPRFELFAEGGGSFLTSGNGIIPCPAVGTCTFTDFVAGSAASSSFSTTGRLTAGGRFRFTPRNALEASYSFSPNQFSVQQGTVTSGPLYNRAGLVSFNYVHYLWAKTPVQPFTTAGLGLNHFSGPGIASAAVVPGAYPFNTDNRYQFAWNFGGGTDIVFQRHFAVRLELRDYVTGQPSFITGTSHNIVPSAGIVFRLK